MEHKKVTSSNIESIGYDDVSKTMEIKFKGGGIYSYKNVSKEDFGKFESANSIGKHFFAHIKNKYPGVKI